MSTIETRHEQGKAYAPTANGTVSNHPGHTRRNGRVSPKNAAALPRLAFTAMEAPAVLGVSDDFFRDHIAAQLRWVRRGSKKLVARQELEAWLEREAHLTLDESCA